MCVPHSTWQIAWYKTLKTQQNALKCLEQDYRYPRERANECTSILGSIFVEIQVQLVRNPCVRAFLLSPGSR